MPVIEHKPGVRICGLIGDYGETYEPTAVKFAETSNTTLLALECCWPYHTIVWDRAIPEDGPGLVWFVVVGPVNWAAVTNHAIASDNSMPKKIV